MSLCIFELFKVVNGQDCIIHSDDNWRLICTNAMKRRKKTKNKVDDKLAQNNFKFITSWEFINDDDEISIYIYSGHRVFITCADLIFNETFHSHYINLIESSDKQRTFNIISRIIQFRY